MALYKYKGNKDPNDATALVRNKKGEEARLGDTIELTKDEHEALEGRLELRKVESDSEQGKSTEGEEAR